MFGKGGADLSKLKKQTFLQGAIILVIANLVTKIIGAVFKIPLANVLNEDGMGMYTSAYQSYVFGFIIATAGLPIAVSKMISENVAIGNTRNTKRIFKVEMLLISALGLLGALVLLLFAEPIAGFMEASEGTAQCIRIIAPALVFVAVMAGLRGYFQGMQNMIPTALSEVVEAAGKPVVGLLLAYLFISEGIKAAAGGAIFGVTAGTIAGALLLIVMYMLGKRRLTVSDLPKGDAMPYGKILKTLVWIAVPITVGACVSSITTFADTLLIRKILMKISFDPETAKSVFSQFSGYVTDGEFDSLLSSGVLSKAGANWLYGSYSGYAMTIYNLPLAMITAIATCVVPALSAAFAADDSREANTIIASSIRITLLISLPCVIGLSVLARPILNALYATDASAVMLQVLSFAIVWVTLVSVTSSILQAAGKVWLPVIHMIIGAAVKIIASFIFISIPSLNIVGASVSTLLCYFTIAALNIYSVMRTTGFRFSIKEFVFKPCVASVIMGIVTVAVYKICSSFISGGRMGSILITLIGMAVAIVVYFAAVFVLRIVKKEDVKMLPKGEKLAEIMEKHRLIKE